MLLDYLLPCYVQMRNTGNDRKEKISNSSMSKSNYKTEEVRMYTPVLTHILQIYSSHCI